MKYSDDEIKKYLSIIDEYNKNNGFKTKSCDSKNFIEDRGYYLCLCCGQIKGRVLKLEIKDYERLHYQKKVFIIENIILRKRLIIFLN